MLYRLASLTIIADASLRKYLSEIFHELAKRKGCEIVEGHLMRDHVHMYWSPDSTIKV